MFWVLYQGEKGQNGEKAWNNGKPEYKTESKSRVVPIPTLCPTQEGSPYTVSIFTRGCIYHYVASGPNILNLQHIQAAFV